MNFNQDHKSLLRHAQVLINTSSLKGTHIDPNDLVNDAYEIFHKSGDEYNFQKFKNLIGDAHFRAVDYQKGVIGLDDKEKQGASKLPNESYCKGCNDFLNTNAFWISFNNVGGFYYPHSKCKKCEYARRKELHPPKPRAKKEKKIKEPKKIGRPKKEGTWFQRNREKWNAYMNDRRVAKPKQHIPAIPIEDLMYIHSSALELPRRQKKEDSKPYEFFIPDYAK